MSTAFFDTSFMYPFVLRCLAWPVEHPFDRIKTEMQVNPSLSSTTQAVKNIVNVRGFQGLYEGFFPSTVRLVGKNIYRWPMVRYFPDFYKTYLPQYEAYNKVFTGLTIAAFESFVITPFELWKVRAMTVKPNTALKTHNIKAWYAGMGIVTTKQVVSWVTFLQSDELFRRWVGKNDDSFAFQCVEGCFVSLVTIAVTTPLDFLKTQYQKEDPLKERVFSTLKWTFREKGIKGLYRGVVPRTLQFFLQTIVTLNFMNYKI